ncbi:MAG: OadG family protein [Clostridia bacterium]|nr:OadG family protein [Clostridia bacterium]MBR3295324.1 OadG family protein [Clostridia bacterium]
MNFMGIEFTAAEFAIALIQVLNTILLLVLLGKLPRKEEKELPVRTENRTAVLPEKDDDTELVAVIAAAIAEFEGTDPENVRINDIREVRKEERTGYRSNWSIVGRREQVNRYI